MLQAQLNTILAALKAIHWHAWNTHWNAAGPQFYSDHELFQRLYEGASPNIQAQMDGLAERIIGLGHKVNEFGVDRRANDILSEIKGVSLVEGALILEQLFQKMIKKALPLVKNSTILDNYLRTMADERSAAIYLLRQRLSPSEDYGVLSAGDTALMSGSLRKAVIVPALTISGITWLMSGTYPVRNAVFAAIGTFVLGSVAVNQAFKM